MAILPGEATLTTTADTVVENTAKKRWCRLRVRNPDSVSRELNIKWGTKQTDKETLVAGETRIFGPEALGSAETLKSWQTSATGGLEMLVRISGEDE